MTPLDAIRIGTLNGAKVMGRNDLGLIETGMKADIIALERSPLEDISCLQDKNNVKLVIKGGVIYKNELT